MAEFKLPQLTESMAAVKLASWLKKEGDTVKKGDPIAEVETDKTNVEIEAPEDGVIQKIHVHAGGDPIQPGTVIATIGSGEGKQTDKPKEEPKAADKPKPAPAPAPKPEPVAAKPAAASAPPTRHAPAPVATHASAFAQSATA